MSLRCRPRNSIAEVYKQREFEVEGATVLKSLRRARQPATRGRTVERIQASAWRRFRMTAVAVAATSLNVLSVVYVSRWRRRRPAPWGRVFTAWTQIVSLYGAYLRSGWCLDMGVADVEIASRMVSYHIVFVISSLTTTSRARCIR